MKRLPILALIVLAGCSPKASDAPVAIKPGDPSKTTPISPAPAGAPSLTPTAPEVKSPDSKEVKPDAPAPKASDLSADLKNDAYEYYGLANTKPTNFVLKPLTGKPTEIKGSLTVSLKSIKDGKAVYEISHSGGLSILGTTELTLEKDGLYATASPGTKADLHSLELPAKLNVGTSWPDHTDIDLNGQTMKFENTVKVIGVQKVKTNVGTYDALLVVSSGEGTANGTKAHMQTKSWYVKGRGPVKVMVVQTPEKGAPQSFTLEETR